MEIRDLKNEIVLKNNILEDSNKILYYLKNDILWNNSMISRKTASFGVPYNYSDVHYEKSLMPQFLNDLIKYVKSSNNFTPNNCLINFYYENKSRMGFHSDQIDILYKNTGIVIFSFGAPRILRFKHKRDADIVYDLLLENNSYLYMSQKIQENWLHAILPDTENKFNERFSLTFRKISS